jgi:hypothetical protein
MLLKKILLPLLAVVVVFLAWSWWQSDSQRIARRVKYLTERVEKSPGEGQLMAALKSQELGGLFAEPFQFRARQFDFETRDRQTLIRTVALYRMRSDRITAQVLDRDLDVDGAGRRATMYLTTRFAGGFGGLGGPGNDAYRFQLNWIEQQGEWKIDYVDLVDVLPTTGPGS